MDQCVPAKPVPSPLATGTILPRVCSFVLEAAYGRRSIKRGPRDRSRIDTHEDYEVRYWSEKFGVSPEQLKAAVKKVGNSAEAVERELKAA
jgi:hypothetical protein